jgi:hypothetical protein
MLNSYMQQLAAVLQYRVNMAPQLNAEYQNILASRNGGGVGVSAPSAQSLALEAMHANNSAQQFNHPNGEVSTPDVPHDWKYWLGPDSPTPWGQFNPNTQIINLAKSAINSGPVKTVIQNLERPLYGLGAVQAGNPDIANAWKFYLNPKGMGTQLSSDKTKGLTGNALHDFWQGATLNNTVTPADSVFTNTPTGVVDKVQQFAGRLMLDTVADPISYVTPGGIGKVLGKTGELVQGLKAGEKAAPVATDLLAKLPAADVSSWAKTPEQLDAQIAAEAAPATGVKAPGYAQTPEKLQQNLASQPFIEAPKVDPAALANQAQAGSLVDLVGQTPRLAHPNLEVAPLFKETTSSVSERVPKTVSEVTQVPAEAPVVEAPKPPSPELAKKRAVKMALLQNPAYKVTVAGGHTVGDMLRVAKENPEQAANIDRILNKETVAIAKDPRKLRKLPLVGVKTPAGKDLGLTHAQTVKMLQTGKVPGDFASSTLTNAKGETVPVEQYLKDLGVVKAPTESVFDFVKNPPTKAIATTKTVFETVQKQVKSTTKLSPAEIINWGLQHTDKLTPREIAYLKAAKTPEDFTARVAKLSTKTVAGNFKTLQEVVKAHEDGLIPDKAWEKLLASVGAKDSEDLLKRSQEILKATGPKVPATPTVNEFGRVLNPDEVAQLERIKGPAPTVWDGVKPVDQIIADAAKGDTSILEHPIPAVTPTLISDVRGTLSDSVIKNLVDPQDLKKYPWVTPIKKAKSTSAVAGKGVHRNLKGWNKYSQGDMFRSLVNKVNRETYTTGLTGKALSAHLKLRSQLMFSRVMAAMNFSEAAFKQEGVKFIAGDQNEGLMLSLMDVLNNLDERTVKKALFTRGRNAVNIHVTKFLDAAANYAQAALHGGNMDLAHEANLVLFSTAGKGEVLGDAAKTAAEMDKAVRLALPKILQRINANYAEQSIKIGESVKSMTDTVVHNVITKFTNPNISMGEAFGDLVTRQADMQAIGSKLKAPVEANGLAKVIGDSELNAEGIVPSALSEAAHAKKLAAGTPEEIRTGGVALQRDRALEAVTDATPAEMDPVNLSDLYFTQMSQGIFRANAPLENKLLALTDKFGRAFYAPFKHADMHYMVHEAHNVTQNFSQFHRGLMSAAQSSANKLAAEEALRTGVPNVGLAKEKLAEAFKLLQQGTAATDPAMAELMDTMKQSTDILFNGGKNAVGSFAVRNGFFADHLNSVMDFYGVPKDFRFTSGKPMIDQANVWRTWENMDDPLDTLDKIHAAFQRATVDVTVGRDLSRVAEDHPWVSTVAKPGFSKVVDKKGVSTIFQFMDPNLYYANEIIKQIPYADRFINNKVFRDDALLRMYDTVLHKWKASVTYYNPTHHVRNIIGDMGLSFLAGVTNPRVYTKAAEIMRTRASSYRDWDSFEALLAGSEAMTKPSSKTITVMMKGVKQKVSYDAVFRGAFRKGLLPGYQVLEDTAFRESQLLDNVIKPFGGRVQKVAGGLSQARDHWVRMAHFTDALEKGNFLNIEHAFDEAGKVVRKWHPDGSDLTSFERQVMRRLIPFYSWFRKAIPLVVEAAVMKPGRFVAIPKASYELAQTMGIDPNSIYDPFPADRLFPSWLRDNILGPQWSVGQNLFGANPGDPVSDLGSSYLGAQGPQQVLGSLTPALRIPMEIGMGSGNNYAKSLGTGSDIPTASEYWTQQLPIISQAGRFTNTDPLAGFAPNRQVQKGNEAPGTNEQAILNWLTGMGIKNYTKPNYVKSAQFELKDNLRRAAQGG